MITNPSLYLQADPAIARRPGSSSGLTWAIETLNLTKRFPPTRFRPFSSACAAPPAVDRVTIQVRSGELFGLLGSNDAGKTTLIKLLCTLIAPTAGAARVNGFDLRDDQRIKGSIGLVTSEALLAAHRS